jgi:hypothetical protein
LIDGKDIKEFNFGWIREQIGVVGQEPVLFDTSIIYIYNNLIPFACLCVWPAIDSATGHNKDLTPVSLKPVWPEGVQSERIFPKKWPVAKLPKKNISPLMLSLGGF